MSAIDSVLNEYKRDAIAKDSYLQKAIDILTSFYEEVSKDQGKLLNIVKREGGNDWIYSKLPLADNGGYSLSYTINKHKDILREPFSKKGFEGIVLYLDVNSIDVILKFSYKR